MRTNEMFSVQQNEESTKANIIEWITNYYEGLGYKVTFSEGRKANVGNADHSACGGHDDIRAC